MTTDVFSLAETTADELRWAEQPRRRWPCLQAAGIGPKELARLGEVLGVGSSAEVLAGFSFLAGESQEPPWVVALPQNLASTLGTVSSDAIETLAAAWDEAPARDPSGSPDRLAAYLRELTEFLERYEGPFVLYISLNAE